MRNRLLSVLGAGALLVSGAIAQHEEHHAEAAVAAPAETSAGTPMMMQMMQARAETAKLVERLAASFAALENESNPAALQVKLAEHGRLVKELQVNLRGQTEAMESMKSKMQDKMKGASQEEHKNH